MPNLVLTDLCSLVTIPKCFTGSHEGACGDALAELAVLDSFPSVPLSPPTIPATVNRVERIAPYEDVSALGEPYLARDRQPEGLVATPPRKVADAMDARCRRSRRIPSAVRR